MKKPKFRPRISRIRLNPEQAVLFCDCYQSGVLPTGQAYLNASGDMCVAGPQGSPGWNYCVSTGRPGLAFGNKAGGYGTPFYSYRVGSSVSS